MLQCVFCSAFFALENVSSLADSPRPEPGSLLLSCLGQRTSTRHHVSIVYKQSPTSPLGMFSLVVDFTVYITINIYVSLRDHSGHVSSHCIDAAVARIISIYSVEKKQITKQFRGPGQRNYPKMRPLYFSRRAPVG